MLEMTERHSWAQDILISPWLANYKLILTSCVLCFAIQYLSQPFLRYMFTPKIWDGFVKAEKRDIQVRFVAIVHAVLVAAEIPGFIWPEEGKFDKGIVSKYYDYSSFSQFWLSIGIGYFLWDMFVSFYYNFDVFFKVHAILSFFVMYFTLNPYMHYLGLYFHGVFELSSPFVHIRHLMLEGGGTSHFMFMPVQILLVLSFTICRVFMGTYYSFFVWWPDMIYLWQNDLIHSKIVIAYSMFANLVLMYFQYNWWSIMIKGIIDLLTGGDGTVDATEKQKQIQSDSDSNNSDSDSIPMTNTRRRKSLRVLVTED